MLRQDDVRTEIEQEGRKEAGGAGFIQGKERNRRKTTGGPRAETRYQVGSRSKNRGQNSRQGKGLRAQKDEEEAGSRLSEDKPVKEVHKGSESREGWLRRIARARRRGCGIVSI